MAQWFTDLNAGTQFRKGRDAMCRLASITVANLGDTVSDDRSQTRYSELEMCEILLLRKIVARATEKVTELTLIDGEIISLPWQSQKLSKAQVRRLSIALTQQYVRVPEHEAPEKNLRVTLEHFHLDKYLYLGSSIQSEADLRVALLDDTYQLKPIQGGMGPPDCRLEYRNDMGFMHLKT